MTDRTHKTMNTAEDPRAEIDQLAEATIAALRAPSILNTQPWCWRLIGDTAELWVEPGRQLANVDPDGRMLMISCGIALHHALTALHAGGYAGEVHRLDDERKPDRVAWLRRGSRCDADYVLYNAIYERHTDRRPFADTAPTGADLDALRNAAERHGAHLHLLTKAQVPELAVAVEHAGQLERTQIPIAADIAAWTNRPRNTRDGVGVRALAPGGQRTVRPRDFTGGRKPGLQSGAGTDGGTVYAMLFTDGDEPRDWMAAGVAFSDVWLTLTARGLAASPISEVVEMPATREQLRQILGGVGHPAIALRVGVPVDPNDPPPASVRRCDTDVIELP
jgi:nitroreductase